MSLILLALLIFWIVEIHILINWFARKQLWDLKTEKHIRIITFLLTPIFYAIIIFLTFQIITNLTDYNIVVFFINAFAFFATPLIAIIVACRIIKW